MLAHLNCPVHCYARGMRYPITAARAIRNNPAATMTAPIARATRSPLGARRSTVMAAVTTAITPQVHDPDDHEDRHQAGTAITAVDSEAQAMPPSRASVGQQSYGRAAVPRASMRGDVPSTR